MTKDKTLYTELLQLRAFKSSNRDKWLRATDERFSFRIAWRPTDDKSVCLIDGDWGHLSAEGAVICIYVWQLILSASEPYRSVACIVRSSFVVLKRYLRNIPWGKLSVPISSYVFHIQPFLQSTVTFIAVERHSEIMTSPNTRAVGHRSV